MDYIDFSCWPAAPDNERPKKLFVNNQVSKETALFLALGGWLIIDVRTMDNRSDAARAEAVKAYLEGVRVGSIEPNTNVLRFVELEAKLYLLNSRPASDKKQDQSLEQQSIDELLNFNSNRAFRGTWQAQDEGQTDVSVGTRSDQPAKPKRGRKKVPRVSKKTAGENKD